MLTKIRMRRDLVIAVIRKRNW